MQHHPHLRKRGARELEPFPARTPGKRALDRLVLAISVCSPLIIVPQIVLVYQSQDVSGISVASWISWTLVNIPWIAYGTAHKELPIVVANSLAFFANVTVLFGVYLYG